MKKTIFTIVGTIVGIILLVIGSVLIGTAGVPDAAEKVLDQIQNNQIEELYQDSQMIIDNTATLEEIQYLIETFDLQNAELVSWGSRGFESELKHIAGTIKLSDGSTKWLTMYFTKTDGELKFSGMELQPIK